MKRWEKRQVKVFYTDVQLLGSCDFFGEPVDESNGQQVIAEENALLITLTREAFFEVFGSIEKFVSYRAKEQNSGVLQKKLQQKQMQVQKVRFSNDYSPTSRKKA